ncbi:MAG: hypothetical protein GY850_41050 [bacterium]|nr:hypothetical protein [bacterium]
MREKKSNIFILMIVIVVSLVWSTAFAEEPSSEKKNWEFNLAPFYLWALSIEGEQTVGSNTGDLDVDFDDIFDILESAFIFNFQGMYKNKWGFLIDYNYMKLGDDDTSGGINKDVDLKLNLVEADGLYRWNFSNHYFDAKFGVRYTSMDTDVKLSGGPSNIEADQNVDWIYPLVGMRWGWRFADRWKLLLNGDVGGFDIGGTRLAWQAGGLIDWQPFKYISFVGGYRAIYQDYEEGSKGSRNYYNFDATMHGPVIGVNFRW